MIVVPIVISSLIVGIAGVGDAKKLGSIGLKTIIYFEVVTTIAIVVGLVLANLFHPGAGIDMSTTGTVDISKYRATAAEVQHEHAFIETLLNLIPSNIFAALMRGEMLPIIFFSVMFGWACRACRQSCATLWCVPSRRFPRPCSRSPT